MAAANGKEEEEGGEGDDPMSPGWNANDAANVASEPPQPKSPPRRPVTPPPPPPEDWTWPFEGERIDVEVQPSEEEPAVWVTAVIFSVHVDGTFGARIELPDLSDQWEDWCDAGDRPALLACCHYWLAATTCLLPLLACCRYWLAAATCLLPRLLTCHAATLAVAVHALDPPVYLLPPCN